MFENELTYITLSGRDFPIRCDMKVLEEIQDKYSDLVKFENLIYPHTPALDKDGKQKKNKEGDLLYNIGMPNIKAVNDALYFMVSEGLQVSGDEPVERNELLVYVDVSPQTIGEILAEEYDKCFVRKNAMTTQKKPMKKVKS